MLALVHNLQSFHIGSCHGCFMNMLFGKTVAASYYDFASLFCMPPAIHSKCIHLTNISHLTCNVAASVSSFHHSFFLSSEFLLIVLSRFYMLYLCFCLCFFIFISTFCFFPPSKCCLNLILHYLNSFYMLCLLAFSAFFNGFISQDFFCTFPCFAVCLSHFFFNLVHDCFPCF